jgi:hypothetical protein
VTTESLAMLATGQIIAAGMFALGVLVGTSLNRKDSTDDDSNERKKASHIKWHHPVSGNTEGGTERRGGSGADTRQ